MDKRIGRRAQGFAAGAVLFALALVLVPALRHTPSPNDGITGPSPAPVKTAAAAREPARAPIPERVSGIPGFARPLDAHDVPPPGASRRPPEKAAAPGSPSAFPAVPLASRGAGSSDVPSSDSAGGAAPSAASAESPASAQGAAEGPVGGAAPAKPAARPAPVGSVHPPGEADAGLAGDGRLGAATAGVLAEARRQKDEAAADPMAAGGIGSMILRGVQAQDKIDSQLRSTIADMQAAGTATPEALNKAAADVISANGGDAGDPEDVAQDLARASGPPAPPVSPQAYAAAAQQVFSGPPLTPEQQAEIVKNVENPPTPQPPAPKNAIQAFQQNRDVFKQAQDQYHVPPEIILGICMVESACGRASEGKLDAGRTLQFLTEHYAGQSRGKQAAADAAALVRLKARDQLGGSTPPVNWAGAMGVPQFLFTSWEAYGRGVGPKRDPRNLQDSILSIANYLHAHGYSQNPGRSILAYNHSTEYENKVLRTAASIKPLIEKTNAAVGTP